MHFNAIVMIQNVPQGSSNLMGEKGWDSVAHLGVLLRTAPVEEVVVPERLEACHFPHRKASALTRVRVNEIVAILGNVTVVPG